MLPQVLNVLLTPIQLTTQAGVLVNQTLFLRHQPFYLLAIGVLAPVTDMFLAAFLDDSLVFTVVLVPVVAMTVVVAVAPVCIANHNITLPVAVSVANAMSIVA